MSYPFRPVEKWDVHTHTTLSPATYAPLEKFTHYDRFIRVRAHKDKPCCAEMVNNHGEVQREIEADAFDANIRLRACDAAGVTVQVLSPTPMMIPDFVDNAQHAAEICKILNDDNAATVALYPHRFQALGALPMMFPDHAIRELERLITIGIKGVEINSNINDKELDDPLFFPIFEAAQALGLAVFIHPWGGFMSPSEPRLQQRMHAGKNWRPWLIGMGGCETALAFDAMRSGNVHARLPKLRVLYAHGGGAFPALLGRLEHGAYCRPDLFTYASQKTPYDTVKACSIYVDTLTHNPWMLEFLIHTLGTRRIAMGSDYPYPLGEIDPFDATSLQDPKGNQCPYSQPKGIYPGHMVEHLPGPKTDMATAYRHFNWIADESADGPRELPRLSNAQKEQLLSGTAKEWLGL